MLNLFDLGLSDFGLPIGVNLSLLSCHTFIIVYVTHKVNTFLYVFNSTYGDEIIAITDSVFKALSEVA